MNEHYQLAVIGSGSGGSEAALLAAKNGLKVVLIEKKTLGGTCLHGGFYSIRALRACAEAAKERSIGAKFGLEMADTESGLPSWIKIQRRVSGRLTQELKNKLEKAGVLIRFGRASLVSPNNVRLTAGNGESDFFETDYIILATGSRPNFDPQTLGPKVVNSDEMLRESDLPKNLLIIGGGYIGCEFASIFRSLGSTVTLVEKEQRLLPGWEESVGDSIAESLRSTGVNIHLRIKVDIFHPGGTEGAPEFSLGNENRIEPDLVLVTTGRKPNIEDLELETLGIEARPFVVVNDQLRTSCLTVFAIGDINGLSLLDSAAVAQARVAVDSILGNSNRFYPRWVPKCIHTDPPIASVGWSEDEAGRAGLEVITHSQTFRLVTDDEKTVVNPSPTTVKILLQAESRQILGVHVIGRQAAEIVNLASFAVRAQFTIEQLLQVPLVHPSVTEAIQECAKGLGIVAAG